MDGAWLTRGNGKCTKSKTGHAEIMGIYSVEIMASGRRHLDCRACKFQDKEDHVCHRNWDGSSKAMEADIIADLVVNSTSFKKEDTRIVALVGDEDSATMKKLNDLVPWGVKKIIDVVHAKKNFGGSLYAARNRLLTPAIIDYLKDCFSYALHQNKNKPRELELALLNIPCHVFNEHENCGDWCGFHRDPENYKHRRIPDIWRGSDDDRVALRSLIKSVCDRFAAKSSSLAPCLSSNANESFNFVVTTFAPKNRHYAGSFSIDRRIDGAVLQKNDGVGYVIGLNKSLNLSPGKHTSYFKNSVAVHRKRKVDKSKLPEEKAKRRKDIQKYIRDQQQKEAREGVQYESAMGFANSEATSNNSINNTKTPRKQKQTKKIPQKDQISENINCSIIVVDTETSGTSAHDEIIQLAALSTRGKINLYCKPSVEIKQKAAEQHKISVRRDKMFQDGKEVHPITRKEMLTSFISFMNEHDFKVLLVGQNVKFDIRFILREVEKLGLISSFEEAVAGFCDSILFFKSRLPNLTSYAQGVVCKEVLGQSFQYDAHNAQADVSALSDCLVKLGYANDWREWSSSLESYTGQQKDKTNENVLSDQLKISGNKVSAAAVKHLVANKISFEMLKEQFHNREQLLETLKTCFKRNTKKLSDEVYSCLEKMCGQNT
jgi:DNA polymerase III epsilon subunit-like protein